MIRKRQYAIGISLGILLGSIVAIPFGVEPGVIVMILSIWLATLEWHIVRNYISKAATKIGFYLFEKAENMAYVVVSQDTWRPFRRMFKEIPQKARQDRVFQRILVYDGACIVIALILLTCVCFNAYHGKMYLWTNENQLPWVVGLLCIVWFFFVSAGIVLSVTGLVLFLFIAPVELLFSNDISVKVNKKGKLTGLTFYQVLDEVVPMEDNRNVWASVLHMLLVKSTNAVRILKVSVFIIPWLMFFLASFKTVLAIIGGTLVGGLHLLISSACGIVEWTEPNYWCSTIIAMMIGGWLGHLIGKSVDLKDFVAKLRPMLVKMEHQARVAI